MRGGGNRVYTGVGMGVVEGLGRKLWLTLPCHGSWLWLLVNAVCLVDLHHFCSSPVNVLVLPGLSLGVGLKAEGFRVGAIPVSAGNKRCNGKLTL